MVDNSIAADDSIAEELSKTLNLESEDLSNELCRSQENQDTAQDDSWGSLELESVPPENVSHSQNKTKSKEVKSMATQANIEHLYDFFQD